MSSRFRTPLAVSANGRYLISDGEPWLWLGDTAWPLFTQYSDDNARAYLRSRAELGYSVIQGVLAWGNGTGFEKPLPDANSSGHRPWRASPADPDPAFFEPVDALVAYAAELGLVLAMLPTWGYYVTDIGLFDGENARVYGRFLGERYRGANNVVWVLGGDRVPFRNPEAYDGMAEGLRKGSGGRQLITYHPCGWHSSSQFYHERDWLDFNMIETWTDWDMVYPAVAADYARTPVKPIVLGEGAYEGGTGYPKGPITPLICRRQAWWAFMAGGYFTNGHEQMWRIDPGWQMLFDTPSARQMGVLRKVVESIRWWQRVPDQGLFAEGVSNGRTLNAAVRGEDSSWALAYLSSQCQVQVYLNKVWVKDVRATWINPLDGTRTEAGTYATGNMLGVFPRTTRQWFAVPNEWEDALLLLEGI
ncbi:MAG: DUF4038 domain-containing protein [Chloroflexi bacterium]|nr:DUF4038 domain-containing protein [Chloroflexota bacterium]